MMINPLEYHGVCGGGADDRVERWGRTGGSVWPIPPRRWVLFLLGGACPPPYSEETRKPSASSKRLRWWFRRQWSLFLWWKGL
jgi:hypothetical protein